MLLTIIAFGGGLILGGVAVALAANGSRHAEEIEDRYETDTQRILKAGRAAMKYAEKEYERVCEERDRFNEQADELADDAVEAEDKLAELRKAALLLAQQADPRVTGPFSNKAVSPDRLKAAADHVRELCEPAQVLSDVEPHAISVDTGQAGQTKGDH
jgi:uncharacterized protein (DUF3084 family)